MLRLFKDPKLLAGTLYLRYFGLRKVPLLFYVRPTLVEWTDARVTFRIPLKRRNKNHLGSMYFAVLAAGADLAAGFLAMHAIEKSGRKVQLVFKSMQADFLKRAEADVHFTCDLGVAVADLVRRAIETGERQELALPVIATVPSKLGDEPVAKFSMTLSLKLKESKAAA